jgi:hypothetical protein
MNSNSPDNLITKPKKLGFFSSFIESCADLNFYSRAFKASWLHVSLHALVLVILISISYSVASYNLLSKGLATLLKDLPTFEVSQGKAKFSKDLQLPYIKKFSQSGAKKLYYILDSGEHAADLEEQYEMYALFTPDEFILSDGNNRTAITVKDIQKDSLLKNFFGDPLIMSPVNLAKFIAFYTVFILALFLFLLLLFLFPIFNLLAATVASAADKWNLKFSEICKLSLFAATPACLIQIIGCLFLVLNWTIFSIGLFLSWSIQIAYLITGLKACKAATEKINS